MEHFNKLPFNTLIQTTISTYIHDYKLLLKKAKNNNICKVYGFCETDYMIINTFLKCMLSRFSIMIPNGFYRLKQI